MQIKSVFYLLSILVFAIPANSQSQTTLLKGTVSYVSSRNVYVKFTSTKNISIGDTLFTRINEVLTPALVVSNKSSTSTVCTPLDSKQMKVADELFVKTVSIKEPVKEKKPKVKEPPPSVEEEIAADEKTIPVSGEEVKEVAFKQKIKGRLSAASYSNLSDYGNSHRMRYAFSLRGDNLKNSRFSTDNYITFRHTIGEWEEVKDNFSNAFKIYALSVKYDIDQSSSLTLGRKINPKISSMGAIDGLQYEKGINHFLFGAILGSRPDYSDYNVNFDLFQVGAYAGLVSKDPKKYSQSTLGFIEQRNKAKVDRRFVYFQHSGELMKNLNLFSSFEMDLYENVHNEVNNTLRLTNFYVSLRYRASRKLRFSTSYDNRRNIIYYESYKNYIDQLIEDETRQGLRLGVTYRPFKYISWGVNSSLRFQKSNENVSKNLNSYISISKIPVINARATLRANFLQTGYLNSRIFGLRISKEIIKRRLNGDLYFRYVDYEYITSNKSTHQNIGGINISLRLLKKLSLYVYYEGTFDDQDKKFHRINTKLIQRF